MVLLLRTFVSDSLLENVGAPFSAVRPGWPLESEGAGRGPAVGGEASRAIWRAEGNTSHADSLRLEPEIESLPFFGTSWYTRGPSYWFRRTLLTLVCLGGVALYPVLYSERQARERLEPWYLEHDRTAPWHLG